MQRKTKTKRSTWADKATTADNIANRISYGLDADLKIDPRDLERIAEVIADAFDFTDKERDAFMASALRLERHQQKLNEEKIAKTG
jgi:hypothetical protein